MNIMLSVIMLSIMLNIVMPIVIAPVNLHWKKFYRIASRYVISATGTSCRILKRNLQIPFFSQTKNNVFPTRWMENKNIRFFG